MGWQSALDAGQRRATQRSPTRVALGVGVEAHVGVVQGGPCAARVHVGVGVTVRPAQIAARGEPRQLVGRVIVDIGLYDLLVGVGVPAIGPMEWVGDVVALVDRRPQRPVGRERQAVAVAHTGGEHPQAAAIGIDGHHGCPRRCRAARRAGVRRAGDIEVVSMDGEEGLALGVRRVAG